MAERVPARKDIANIHLNVPHQGFVSIAQCLKRLAKRIVPVKIISPDKAVIRAIDRFSIRARQAANENGDIASRCHKNAQCTKSSETNIVGVEFTMVVLPYAEVWRRVTHCIPDVVGQNLTAQGLRDEDNGSLR